jgi:hypothetical protein
VQRLLSDLQGENLEVLHPRCCRTLLETVELMDRSPARDAGQSSSSLAPCLGRLWRPRLRKWAAPQLERSALGPRPAVKAADKIVEGAALIPALEWSNLELLKCFEGFEDPELDLACQ